MDPAEALALGRKMGAKVCPHGQWSEDVQAAAALGAWLARPGCEAIAAKRAAIDELRRLTNRNRHGRGFDTVALTVEPTVEDAYLLDDPCANLDARTRMVVEMLADGWEGQQVAKAIGVCPSRVSKIVRRARVQTASHAVP